MQFDLEFLDDYTEATIIRELQRIAEQCPGTKLSTRIFERLSPHVSVSTVRRRFGSWQLALKAAGLVPRVSELTEDRKMEPSKARFCQLDSVPDVQRAEPASLRSSYCQTHAHDYVPYRLRFAVLQRDRFKCVICGRSPATHRDIELVIQHILPAASGGKNVLDNVQTRCFQHRGCG